MFIPVGPARHAAGYWFLSVLQQGPETNLAQLQAAAETWRAANGYIARRS